MADFTGSTRLGVAPDTVFDFLAEVDNLPRYFSRMTSAEPGDGDEVRTSAVLPDGEEVQGRAWFQIDRDDRHLAWGSEGPHDYRGDLAVRSLAGRDGTSPASEVAVHLHTTRVGSDAPEVQRGIDDTLLNIKQLLEGEHVTLS